MKQDQELDRFHQIDLYVGMQLKRVRTEKKISRQQISDWLEISETQLNKYETGKNRISPGKLFVLSQSLNVPIWEFFPVQFSEHDTTDPLGQLQQAFQQLPDAYTKSRIVELVQCMAYGPKHTAALPHKLAITG